MAVSGLLIIAFMNYTGAMRVSSELRQLKNLMDQAAAKSTELLTTSLATNATIEAFIQVPAAIGEREYWLQLRNDSSKAWIEGGLGNNPTESGAFRVYLPKETSAMGDFIGGHGALYLSCRLNAGTPAIELSSSSESG